MEDIDLFANMTQQVADVTGVASHTASITPSPFIMHLNQASPEASNGLYNRTENGVFHLLRQVPIGY